MLTDQDISKLAAVLATKQDIVELTDRIVKLEESVNALTTSIDGLIGELKKLRTEYSAMSNKLNRHETWIKQLAQKLGVNLEY